MRILVAFIITVMVYMLLLWLYFTQFNLIKVKKKKFQDEHIIKIDIQNFQTSDQKIASPRPIAKPKKNKKQKVFSKIQKKDIKKVKKMKQASKVKKKPKKLKKRVNKKKSNIIPPSEMIFIANPLMLDTTKRGQVAQSTIDPRIKPTPLIQKLYGQSFDTFTHVQKKFIVDNLDDIHRITQQTLSYRGYPSGALAAKTGQEGTNIVSFNLHPNGDITNLRLLRKVGYRALDENTLETIRTAYKDYPYPREITQIIFYVEYSIFGY